MEMRKSKWNRKYKEIEKIIQNGEYDQWKQLLFYKPNSVFMKTLKIFIERSINHKMEIDIDQ